MSSNNSNGSNERATVHASIIRGSYDIPCGTGRGGTRPSQIHPRRLIAGTGGRGATRAERSCRSLVRQWSPTAKRSVLCLALLCCLVGAGVVSAFDQPAVYQLKSKDHLLIMGDSTTARGIPVAGFVPLTDQAQREQLPELGAKATGLGYDMSTSRDLIVHYMPMVDRMLLAPNPPTVVALFIGLNNSGQKEAGVGPYTEDLRTLHKLLTERKLRVIYCTPSAFVSELNRMKPYAEAARKVAAELKCPLIDVQAAWVEHVHVNFKDGKFLPNANLTADGCHFSQLGENLTATTILQGLGLKPVWQKYQLRTGFGGGGRGKVTVAPELPFYPPGTKVMVKVTIEAGDTMQGWAMDKWSDIVATGAEYTVTMSNHHAVVALIRRKD